MRIALLGSAPSSINQAPWKNSSYEEWIQGKVQSLAIAHGQIPGDWEIWGCSPGCWAVAPRATRWFEVHRWEPGQAWFSDPYVAFLMNFKGPVYTGAVIPEIKNHVVYPIDRMEEKFSSYFMTSSLALMMALAIDEIEHIREARAKARDGQLVALARYVDPAEVSKSDDDDMIGMWGVDMAAQEEYAYQRPGCQFFVLEAMRRGIAVYLPPESDLMRPMPVYGMSEWDHNYVKLTQRARELNSKMGELQKQAQEAQNQLPGLQGEMHALNYFVNTWTSPYGMKHGMVIRQAPGTGLGSGITHLDERPITRMTLADYQASVPAAELDASVAEFITLLRERAREGEKAPDTMRRLIQQHDGMLNALTVYAGEKGVGADPAATLHRALTERGELIQQIHTLESQLTTRMKKTHKRRR